MAYADKITTMRRMALIKQGHNIHWEGVLIEGICLLKKVSCYGDIVMTLNIDNLANFCEQEELIWVYLDGENEPSWEPRLSYEVVNEI